MSALAEHPVSKRSSKGDRGPSESDAERLLRANLGCEGTDGWDDDADDAVSVFGGGQWLEVDVSLNDCRVILIPVDFSPDSEEAVRQSLILARSLGADLLLLHVVHDLPGNPGFYHKKKASEKLIRKMTEAAEDMMSEFIGQSRLEATAEEAGTKLSIRLTRGLPTTQILHTAKRDKAGLIVMGSSGRTGISRLLMGSTAEQVVRLAETPVMVVKSGDNR